jgi:hypothetical protein
MKQLFVPEKVLSGWLTELATCTRGVQKCKKGRRRSMLLEPLKSVLELYSGEQKSTTELNREQGNLLFVVL